MQSPVLAGDFVSLAKYLAGLGVVQIYLMMEILGVFRVKA